MLHNRRWEKVNTSVTIHAVGEIAVSSWIFLFRELLFFDFMCYPVEMAYFCSPNRDLIESYSTVSCLCSCIEKKYRPLWQPILLWPCMLIAKCNCLHFQMLLFFSLTSYPAEIACFNSPNRELSNFVQLIELYWKRNVHPSWSPCLKTVNGKRFERRNFLV